MFNKWTAVWQDKRMELNSRVFGLVDVIQSQYYKFDKRIAKDKELVRLKSTHHYSNTATGVPVSYEAVPYFASKFCRQAQYSNIFATADEAGILSLYDVHRPQELRCWDAIVKNAIFDILWVPGETKILALCGDHTARLYDIGESQITPILTFDGHTKSVKTADFSPCDSAVFATGSRDGQVLLFDSRASVKPGRSVGAADQCIAYAAGGLSTTTQNKKKVTVSSSGVTALGFQDTHSLVVCGCIDECIRTWDLRMTYHAGKVHQPRCLRRTQRKGYNDLKISADKTRMYASSLGGAIYCFNLNSYDEKPIAEFHGHDAGSFYVKTSLSDDGEYLASGSTDHSVRIWKTARAELQPGGRAPMLRLAGHRGEVTGVDISSSPTFSMVSCGEDGTFRTWLPTATPLDVEERLDTNTFLAELTIEPVPEVKKRRNRLSVYCQLSKTSAAVMSAAPIAQRSTLTPESSQITPKKTLPLITYASDGKRKIKESPKRDVKKMILSPAKANEYKSPTLNLPNYVMEGTGPWHSCPRVRQNENLNWLTEIRRKSADKRSNSVEIGKRRRSLHSKRPASRRTLLEYYTKSSKPSEEPLKTDSL